MATIEQKKDIEPSANALPPSSDAVDSPRGCLNCGTPLGGTFCSSCGQRDIPPYPSVRELASDAAEEVLGWDGRFMFTLRSLIRHPGMLTREFLEGRRARYVSPLRLYLAASLAYFLVGTVAPEVTTESGEEIFAPVRTSTITREGDSASRPEQVGRVAATAIRSERELTAEQREAVLAQIKSAPPLLQPFLRRSVEDPEGFRRGIVEAMPRMLFALLPVLAAIIALFYRGRKYPEHLYFAVHLNAFIFVALTVIELTKFTRSDRVLITVGAIVLATIPVYATLAFRRLYGGSLVGTVAKEIGIAAIYSVVSFTAFATMVYLVAIAG